MIQIFNAHMQCVSGSAIPLTMAIASQTGVKGIASGALKISFTKSCTAM